MMDRPIQYVEVDKIIPSPLGHRLLLDPQRMQKLEDSIRLVGVEVPLRLRPRDAGYELVCGERRWRAAKAAGLVEVPALVRAYTDAEVVATQLHESATPGAEQEEAHPLEEADAYRILQQRFHVPVEQIAQEVDRSTAHIYHRLRLGSLSEAARRAFLQGHLQPSTALCLARLPTQALQDKALAEVTSSDRPLGVDEACRRIRERYMLRLADAPFSTQDPTLPGGACSACPRNTGMQRLLFEEASDGDFCTDPDCYASKIEAVCKQRAPAPVQAEQAPQPASAPPELRQPMAPVPSPACTPAERIPQAGWPSGLWPSLTRHLLLTRDLTSSAVCREHGITTRMKALWQMRALTDSQAASLFLALYLEGAPRGANKNNRQLHADVCRLLPVERKKKETI